MFRPQWAKFLAPIYAIAQGFAVGAISKAYETWQDGIVLQAVGATLGVFVVMLLLYRTNIIKVTERFRRIVIGATLGVMVFYLGLASDQPVRRRLVRSSTTPARSASASACSSAASPRSTWPSTSTSSSAVRKPAAEGRRVVRRLRPAGHHRVAVPRDPAPALQAAPVRPAARRRLPAASRPSPRRRARRRHGSLVGLGWPAAVVGAVNGAIRRQRGSTGGVSGRGSRSSSITWALLTTAGVLVGHVVAAAQGRRRVRPRAERPANRHVYTRGLRMRRGFAITVGNVVSGAGDASGRARRAAGHRPRGRPHLASPLVRAAVSGAVRRVDGRRRCGRRRDGLSDGRPALRRRRRDERYYLNPFEWWAYSRTTGGRRRTRSQGSAGHARACGPLSQGGALLSRRLQESQQRLVERRGRLLLGPVADRREHVPRKSGSSPSSRRRPAGRRSRRRGCRR